MKEKIKIKSDDFQFEAEIFGNLNPSTFEKILSSLPVKGKVNRWGDEIYFDAGVEIPIENSTTNIEVGDIAFWPQGKSIAIFFGPTPMSVDEQPVPASSVNVFGKVLGVEKLIKKLQAVKDGAVITVKKGK